jgi:hypothetical protein
VADYEPEATAVARYIKPGRPARKKHRRRITKASADKPAPADG